MKHVVTIHEPYSALRVSEVWDRFRWLRENVGQNNFRMEKVTTTGEATVIQYSFHQARHAVLFKLTWGGK